MKNILVPTDFSTYAENALKCAIQIGNRFDSTIHLLHTFRVSSRAGMLISVESYILEDARFSMNQLVKRYEEKLENKAQIKMHILRGDTAGTIAYMADEDPIDLVVMGTQGASGLKEIFMGSTTSAVINQTDTPVLAIPSGCTLHHPEHIVFAIDDDDISSPRVISPLIKIARAFDAHISVFHIEKGEEDAGIDPSVDIFLDSVDHSFHYDLYSGENINDNIKKFLLDYRGDMLCMIRRDRGIVGRLFHQSVTKKEVFQSDIPILVLHDS